MSHRRSSVFLCLLFLAVLVMGPGPGVWLVNPAQPARATSCWGAPVIWLWAIGWLGAEWMIVLIAYRWLWTGKD